LLDNIVNETTFNSALKLGKLGFAVFPCFGADRGDCTCGNSHESDQGSKGKHPAISGWPIKSSTEQEDIQGFFETPCPMNLAIDCRKSDLLIVDIDPRSSGDDSFAKLIELFPALSLLETVEAETGIYSSIRGRHLYFKKPPGLKFRGNLSALGLPGIDIKVNGYVIAPPSQHQSGAIYEWVEGKAPWQSVLADLPEDLLDFISLGVSSVDKKGETLAIDAAITTPYGAKALRSEVDKLANTRIGNRNNALFEAGLKIGSLVGGGEVAEEEAKSALIRAGLSLGLDHQEVERTLLRAGGALDLGSENARSADRIPSHLFEWATSNSAPRAQKESLITDSTEILKKFNRVDWTEVFEGTPEEEWLVPGILCAGRSHAIYADAGVGKTLLMHDICAALSSGMSVLGLPAIEPITVLYIDHENTVHGDVVPHFRDMGYSASDLSKLIYLSFPEMHSLDSYKGGLELEVALDEFEPSLVVIDTVSRTVAGDENANDTWLQFYNHAGKAIKKRGIAYVRLDHTGKNADAGMRGGSAKSGDVDLVWKLTRRKDGLEFLLKCEKTRVPIHEHTFGITRLLAPLRHQIQGASLEIEWDLAIRNSDSFEFCCSLLQAEIEETGSMAGQTASWKKHQGILKPKGISRQVLFAAHRFTSGIPPKGEERH